MCISPAVYHLPPTPGSRRSTSGWRTGVFAPAAPHPGPEHCFILTTLPLCTAGWPSMLPECFHSRYGQHSLHCIYVKCLLLFLRNKQENQNLTKHRLYAFLSFPLPAGSWVFGPAVFMFPCSLLCFRRSLTAVHVWKLQGMTSPIRDKLVNSSLFEQC